MHGSDHKSLSLSSTSNKPSLSKDTDENGQVYHESNKPTKMTTAKHFMSPTISATSKANPPRKKILAERNESLDNYLQKSENRDSKSLQKATSLDSKSISSTEFGESEQNDVLDDLLSGPHDPLTNYLSPRPKFLRYKPNRRREILLRREIMAKDGKEGSLELQKDIDFEGDLASSFGSLPQEGEEIDGSDDEFEDFEEERGWSLRELLKVLILLVVLVLSTSYISSMNSPNSPVVQAVADLKDGYHMMQEHAIGFVKIFEPGKYLLFDTDGGVLEEAVVEDVKTGEAEGAKGDVVEIRSAEINVIKVIEDEAEEREIDNYTEGVEAELWESEDDEEEREVNEYNEGEESEDGEIVEQEGIVGKWNEILELLEKGDGAVHEAIKEETFETERVGIGNITDDYRNENEAGSNMKEAFIKQMGADPILKAVIGFSVVSSVIASMVLGLHFINNRKARENNTHPPVIEPCFDSATAEKCSLLVADEEEEHINSPASSAISKSAINSMKEDSKAIQESSLMSFSHQSRAPTVELLGELELGEEMSSSLRNCGVKSITIESEVSSHSVSVERGVFGTNPSSNHVHLQHATFTDISTVNDLPSHSNEKRALKKEEVVTTPLRRSSRIRNRAALSP